MLFYFGILFLCSPSLGINMKNPVFTTWILFFIGLTILLVGDEDVILLNFIKTQADLH